MAEQCGVGHFQLLLPSTTFPSKWSLMISLGTRNRYAMFFWLDILINCILGQVYVTLLNHK